MAWHNYPLETIFEKAASGPMGLTAQEAERRLAQYGPNELQEKKKKPAWVVLLPLLAKPTLCDVLCMLPPPQKLSTMIFTC